MSEAKRYYETRKEVEAARRRGERVYYKPGKGYYLIKLRDRKSFWEKLWS
jgi:hypothetical protein